MKEFSSTNLKRYHLNFLNIKQHASQKYLFTWKNDFEGTRLLCFFILQSRSFLERIAFAKQKIRWQLVK